MSAGAEVLGPTIESAGRIKAAVPRVASSQAARVAASPEIISLARQAFFPNDASARQRVLFVSADDETNVTGVAEQVARTLAAMQKTVSLVERRMEPTSALPAKKPPVAVRNVEYW